jgi:hypothetical protein
MITPSVNDAHMTYFPDLVIPEEILAACHQLADKVAAVLVRAGLPAHVSLPEQCGVPGERAAGALIEFSVDRGGPGVGIKWDMSPEFISEFLASKRIGRNRQPDPELAELYMSTARYMSEAIIGILRVAGFEPFLNDDGSDAVMVEVPDHTWTGEEFKMRR